MINFFRKIRKKLAVDNKPLKYMRYAIGEILLVVIGILIALQINAWNGERKDRKLEINYLENLKKELVFNIQLALEQNEFSDFQIKNGELILASLESNFRQNPMELVIALEHIGWNHEIIFISDVWGELYATGNIGIIKNNEIKSKLTDIYNVMSLVNKFQENEWSAYNFGVRRLLGDVLSPAIRLKIYENLEPSGYTGEKINIPNQDRTIEKLKDLEGLNGYIVDIIGTRKTSNVFMLGQIEGMKSVIALINKELE